MTTLLSPSPLPVLLVPQILGFFSTPNPPPMPDINEQEAAGRVSALTLTELSRYNISSSTSPPCAKLPALLRRCLLLLPILSTSDPIQATRCCRGLFASLGAIVSRDPSPSLLPALEVFAGSLVFSDRLLRFFAMSDCAAPEGSRIFTEAPCLGEHHVVLELVCRHFISSLHDEGGFQMFLSALSWSGRASLVTPEISFQGALALVQRTCLLSLTGVIQAHLLLLMSRCVNGRNMDLHFAFEQATNLYVRYLPALHAFNRIGGMETPLNCLSKERPFNTCIKDATEQKLRSQIDGLLSFCQLHSGDDLPINESDIDRLIEENQDMLHEKIRQEATMVVKGILSGILYRAKQNEVNEPDAEVSDEILCLAAVLRVMGSSLPHILHRFAQMRSASDKDNRNYVTLCKEYEVTHKSICLLGQHKANELYKDDLLVAILDPVERESTPMLMLSHFSSLATYSVRRRLGFMWKGCVIMMMMAMNLISVEESLGTFQLPIDVPKESAVFPNTKERIKVSARIKAMAVGYKNIHKLHNGDGIRVGKTNGQAFLECHPEYSSSWDDLSDFVECEEGKDYSNSLKQRRRFDGFKYKKWVQTRGYRIESMRNAFGLK
ncbi:hypothetical protein BS78_09G026600 [Paspalum vaginatum]|nr:hypothetical protein BS78_09G026600 [Paspalum vaginatum]